MKLMTASFPTFERNYVGYLLCRAADEDVMNFNRPKQLRVVSSMLASRIRAGLRNCRHFPGKKVDQGYCPMEVWIKGVDLC